MEASFVVKIVFATSVWTDPDTREVEYTFDESEQVNAGTIMVPEHVADIHGAVANAANSVLVPYNIHIGRNDIHYAGVVDFVVENEHGTPIVMIERI